MDRAISDSFFDDPRVDLRQRMAARCHDKVREGLNLIERITNGRATYWYEHKELLRYQEMLQGGGDLEPIATMSRYLESINLLVNAIWQRSGRGNEPELV